MAYSKSRLCCQPVVCRLVCAALTCYACLPLLLPLQAFFHSHPHLQRRPLVIAGESYAGR